MAHILFGSVALVTACLQIWPWLRRTHPDVHRWSGRFYLFDGVFPGGLSVHGVAPVSSTGPVSAVGGRVSPLPARGHRWKPGPAGGTLDTMSALTLRLVARRHVDLHRVSSALCRDGR